VGLGLRVAGRGADHHVASQAEIVSSDDDGGAAVGRSVAGRQRGGDRGQVRSVVGEEKSRVREQVRHTDFDSQIGVFTRNNTCLKRVESRSEYTMRRKETKSNKTERTYNSKSVVELEDGQRSSCQIDGGRQAEVQAGQSEIRSADCVSRGRENRSKLQAKERKGKRNGKKSKETRKKN
jgi:hypothetical protein